MNKYDVENRCSGAEVRPLTKEAYAEFYPDIPLRNSIRGYVLYQDGELIGIAGIELTAHGFFVFSDIKEGAKINKQTVWRCAKFIMQMVDERGVDVFAYSDINNKQAHKFCEACGFEEIGEDETQVYFHRRAK